jgi:hypothetical protein
MGVGIIPDRQREPELGLLEIPETLNTSRIRNKEVLTALAAELD